jgi:hypothetical protein
MKEGAGEDPFAEDADGTSVPTSRSDEGRDPPRGVEAGSDAGPDAATDSDGAPLRIPYKFRRDGVQDGRDRVPLFVQPDTKSAERDARRELENRFDDSVSLTDLREALVMVGLRHLDEVEAHLEEWGYGMTFDD